MDTICGTHFDAIVDQLERLIKPIPDYSSREVKEGNHSCDVNFKAPKKGDQND